MSDAERLELAAKAAGIKVWHGQRHQSDMLFREVESNDGKVTGVEWNPLDNDGDALRLAAKLRISIDFNDCCAWSRGIFGLVQEFWGGDYPPCYRNAIVRAAAEIAKPEGV